MSFSKCPLFRNNQIQYSGVKNIRLPQQCPECKDKGYDGERVRMVKLTSIGFEGETGPEYEVGRWGREHEERLIRMVCCVVM